MKKGNFTIVAYRSNIRKRTSIGLRAKPKLFRRVINIQHFQR